MNRSRFLCLHHARRVVRLGLLLALSPLFAAEPANAPLNVTVVRAKRGEIARSITLPAVIRANQRATLNAKVTGYLKTIAVDRGDRVKQGDVLAEIEVPELLAD